LRQRGDEGAREVAVAEAALAIPPEPVAVTVARHVAPGREADFEEWAARLTGAGANFPGFLGAGLLRPGHVGEDWHVVFRFDSSKHLDAWERSPTRAAPLAAGSSPH
jgi:antibiotic biosynthesis monooxygenase (ABM) superfamily enzyme